MLRFTARRVCVALVGAAGLLCLVAGPALADEDDFFDNGDVLDDVTITSDLTDDLQETPGFDTDPKAREDSDWSFMLGILAGVRPDYEGSSDYEFTWSPNYKIAWRDTVILQGKNLRVQYKGDNFRVGVLAAREPGRDEDDNSNLDGLGDVDSGWAVGVFGRWEIVKRLRAIGEFRQEVANGHGGWLLDAGLDLRLPFGKPWVRAYYGATFASSDYMEEFFSVSAAQSAASGKPVFDAGSGLKNLTFSLSSGYDITDNWVIGAILKYDRLADDAGDSPIVEEGGSRNQFFGGVSLGYQF